MSRFKVQFVRHGGVSLGVLAALTGFPTVAASQEAAAPPAPSAAPQGVQEIVVTAQRREENLQKVPVSVTALSGADLAARAIVDSTDIVKLVPALKYNAYSPSTTVYNLRGVSQNDYSDQLEPPVAVYQDDSYLSSMATAGFPLFDIERVEVLRGPQGTLFGRNATGGAIQYISRKPTDEFSLNGSATWFSDGGYAVEVGAGGPVSDTLAVRFALDRVQRDGFVKSNNPAIGDTGGTNQFAGRVQLLWKPAPGLKILLRAMRSKDDNSRAGGTYTYTPAVPADHGRGVPQAPTDDFWGTGPGVDPNGYVKPASYGLYENNNNVPSIFDRTIQAYTGRIDWSVGNVTIVSITDYQRMSKFYQEDCDGTPLNGCIFAPRTSLRQFSQELRVEGNTGPLRWVAGANYIDIDGHYQSHAEYNLIALDYFSTGDSNYYIRTKSPSVFAQGTYELTDKLKFTAGARYTRDKKTDNYHLDFTSSSGDQVVDFNPGLNPDLARKHYNLYSGKAQFDYSPSDNVLLFAGVTRGTKSGNFSAPVSLSTVPLSVVIERLPHGPEVLWDYEAGIKSKFLDNRLRVNASAFYYDYHNYQAFSLIDLVQTISNHDAWVYGGELEVTAVPVDGLNISGGLSYLKSKVKGIGLPDGTVTDSQLPQAPRWSGNASISYTLPVGNGDLTARLDGTFTSKFCFSVVCAPVEREKAYQTLDGSLSYKFDSFTLTAFAKNLTAEKYRTYALDVSSLGFLESIYTRPRYYGVTLSVNYGR